MFHRLPLAICLCALPLLLCAQKPAKWGNIPEEDLRMTVYSPDSAASAVVLQDVGKLKYEESADGFALIFEQHRRIKVFDQSAFKEGNLLIPYYSGGRTEKFRDLDVQVFSPDGKKTRVKTDHIFTEKINEYVSAKKVFVPNLQKGCILEYRFRIETEDWLTMRDWYFQDVELPTRWSELTFDAPSYFEYVTLTTGNHLYDVNEHNDYTDYYAGTTLPYDRFSRRMGMRELPALKPERFMTAPEDYCSRVIFQLQTIRSPRRPPIQVLSSWTQLAEELDNRPLFGAQYRRPGNSDRLWEAFKNWAGPIDVLSPETLQEKVLQFVAANIRWNGEYHRYTEGDLDAAFARKTGNSAEVNLAVVALLRRADVPAKPLLVSTRSHGACRTQYPLIDQFNSVLAYVPDPKGDGGRILDATSPFHPVGFAGEEAFNGEGWIVDKEHPQWIPIKAPESAEIYLADLALGADGTLSGHMGLQLIGHAACSFRERLAENRSGSFIARRFSDKYPETRIDSLRIENVEALAKPLKADFSVVFPNAAQIAGDFIYCTPVADFFYEENPFKTLKRLYPVNFTYPVRAQYILNLQIPPGYQVDEMPPGLNLVLPNDGGRLVYMPSVQPDGNLQIILRLNLRQLDFQPEEYDALRVFFDKIVEKINEPVVLKKIATSSITPSISKQ